MGRRPLTIENMQDMAAERGGTCLSTTYVNSYTKLRWQCAKGHTWEAWPGNIQQGTWCPVCAHRGPRQGGTIEQMQELAAERGGKCLSATYVNATTRLTWQCAYGHTWQGLPGNIQQGHWCPTCARTQQRGTIEQMQDMAARRGGTCLSTTYVNSQTKLTWQCAKGHTWQARPYSIRRIRRGTWCPVCAHRGPRQVRSLPGT